MLRLVNDLLGGMENQEVSALIASCSFRHCGPRHTTRSTFKSVCDTALNWIDSYLRPRSCQVSVNSTLSSPHVLQCSVPQGSCLGPWLYLTYAGTLFDIVPPSMSVYGFAGDHLANKRFRPDSVNSELHSIKELEDCALSINSWMRENKLKMNNSKQNLLCLAAELN